MSRFLEMKIFVKIVDAGTITKAAEQLGIAKSAVSRRLAELEQRLGVHLLNRTTRSSKLTDAGLRYYKQSVRILNELAELEADITNKKTDLSGVLNLALPASFGLLHVRSAIEAFMTLHPSLTINLHFSDKQIDLVEGGFDLAIRIARLKDSTNILRKISPVRILLCASPKYLENRRPPEHPKDLKNHDGLHYSNSPGSSWKFERLSDKKSFSVKVPVKMSANNGDFLLDMALAGHGVVILPSFLASEKIKSGELVILQKNYQPPTLSAFVVYPQTYHLAKRVRVFVDFLSEYFSGEPKWDVGL